MLFPPRKNSRICGRKGIRWEESDSRALEPGRLVSRKRLLPDICTREVNPGRKGKRCASAAGLSGFLFAFSQGGDGSLQIGKQRGKSRLKSRFSDKIFPERGGKTGDMRTILPRSAEKKSVHCGKRRALVRTKDSILACFRLKSVNKYKWLYRKTSYLGRKEKRAC